MRVEWRGGLRLQFRVSVPMTARRPSRPRSLGKPTWPDCAAGAKRRSLLYPTAEWVTEAKVVPNE